MRRTTKRRAVAGILAAAIGVVTAGAVAVTSSTRSVDAAAATGKFYVVGGDIIAPDGSKFVPVGANVGADVVSWNPPTFAFTSQGHYANGRVDDALAWGWNMVRVNVVCNVDGVSVTTAETVAGVQSLIDEYTAEQIVVMPACHDVTGGDVTNLASPAYVKILAFWDQIVASNKTNPYVWINPVNEPFTQWGSNDPGWAATANTLYDRFRATGSENLFMWDFSGWGQGIEDASDTNSAAALAAGKCNFVFGWHNYGATGSDVNRDWHWGRAKAKNIAVVVSELGYDWAGYRSDTTTYANDYGGANWTMSKAFSEGFGALVWHGTDSAGTQANNLYALRTNGQGGWYDTTNPLSDLGQKMFALGTVNRPAKTFPAVNLAASNCASQQTGAGTTTTSAVTTTTVAATTTTSPATTTTVAATTTTSTVAATTTTAAVTTTTVAVTTTTAAATTTTVQTGGITYGRPFAASSPWNTPTPAGTVWSDHIRLHTVPFDNGGDSRMHWWVDNSSSAVVYAQPGDQMWTLNVPAYIDPANGRNRPAATFHVHAPASVANVTGADKSLAIVDGSTYYEINGVQVDVATHTITGLSAWATGSTTTGNGAGNPANNDGVRGANTSILGGLITGRDFQQGQIDHAVAVALPWHMINGAAGTGYRAPATAYAAGGWAGPIQMGSKLGIPANTPMPAGLSPAGVMMFNALKNYGGYVSDYVGGAWPSFYADANTTTGAQVEPLFAFWASNGSADMEKIAPLMRVADYTPTGGTLDVPVATTTTTTTTTTVVPTSNPVAVPVYTPTISTIICTSTSESSVPPIGPMTPGRIAVCDVGGIPTLNIPPGALVRVRVTASDPTSSGAITVFPNGTTRPPVRTMTFSKGSDTSKVVYVRIGADGHLAVYSTGTTNVIVAVLGYYI